MNGIKPLIIPIPARLNAEDAEIWRAAYERAYKAETGHAENQGQSLTEDALVAKAARFGWFALAKRYKEQDAAQAAEDTGMTNAPAPTAMPVKLELESSDARKRASLRVAKTYASQGKSILAQEHLNIAGTHGTVTPAEVNEVQEALDVFRSEADNTPSVSDPVHRRFFTTEERDRLAKSGKALPDGSFPIVDEQDLKNAIKAHGRATDKSRAISHIIKRAKAMGLMRLVPSNWVGKSIAGQPELPEWWIDKTAERLAEAMYDEELRQNESLDEQIVRPDSYDSNDWVNLSGTERTLRSHLHRRAVRRNYYQAADDLVLEGWEVKSITGKKDGELEFRQEVDGILERAILVREARSTSWYPKVMGHFAAGSTLIKLATNEVRFR